MTIKEFKKIAQLLNRIYKELELEAIQNGVNVLSGDFDLMKASARDEVLRKFGFTLQDYKDAKAESERIRRGERPSFEEIKSAFDELRQLPVLTKQEVEAIAEEAVKKHPPQIINKIVKEVKIEKPPQVIKETVVNEITNRVEYDDKELKTELKNLKKKVDAIEIPEAYNDSALKEFVQNNFAENFKKNIDTLGMPDFRKLAMGLQHQIDSLEGGGGTDFTVGEIDGSPVVSNPTAIKFTNGSVTDNGDGTVTVTTGAGGGGDVSKVGTPANNQLAIWTGDGTIEGDANLTYDGTSLNLATGKVLKLASVTVLSDPLDVMTLSNINAIDATTEATIEGAIDTLANLTSIQGRTVTLADAGADALFGWDDSDSAYKNLSASDAKTALSLVKGDVGLGNVDNTSDANKPVSTATQTALDLKANLASPTFTGTVTVPATNFTVGASLPFSDTAGTLTLQNVDALDATTESTIEAAIDTLANLTSIQGRTVTLADAGANAIFGWDDTAGAYENLTQAEVKAVIGTASDSATGVVELATDAETVTGTDTARAVTPANLTARLAAPGTIGGTTAGAITGTTITANTGFMPDANDGAYLGQAGTAFADLFLAEGGVINWDSGDATITQTGNVLAVAGADLRVATADVGTNADSVPTLSSTSTLTNKTLTSPTLTTPSAFTTGGTITLAENTSIALDPAGSADGKYSGITVAGTAGTTLAFGDLVYLAAADSRWELADADAASTSGDVMLGIVVLAAAADGDPTTILLHGIIRADAAFPALTISAQVYVSTTAGDIQTAQPSGTDDVIRVVGRALTADEIYFHPAETYWTHT
jgi:hypothetical protein